MIFGKSSILDGYVHEPLKKNTLERISNGISEEEYKSHVREHSSYALYRIGLTDELEGAFNSMVRGEELPRSTKSRLMRRLQAKALRKDSLCYCPLCMREEMEKNGEPYWHRHHQLPGVVCCTKHKVKLVPIFPLMDIQGYFIPAYWVVAQKGIAEPVPELDEAAFLLAQDIEILLNKGFDLNIRQKYINMIAGLNNMRGIIRSDDFLSAERRYMSIIESGTFMKMYCGCFYDSIYSPNYLSIILLLRVMGKNIRYMQ